MAYKYSLPDIRHTVSEFGPSSAYVLAVLGYLDKHAYDRFGDEDIGTHWEREQFIQALNEVGYSEDVWYEPQRLPAGLTLSEDGALSGVASGVGTYTLTVSAQEKVE